MNTKKIKAVMSDVDGTLLTDEVMVSPDTIHAIKALREHDILFGICSGRDLNNVKTLIQEWGLAGLVDMIVGSGGAEIYDYHTDTYQKYYPLTGAFIQEIMDHYQDMDLNFAVPKQGTLLTPKEDRYIKMLSTKDKVPYKVVDFQKLLEEEFLKVMLICDPENMDHVIRRSQTFNHKRYRSAGLKTAAILFEYMDPRISKTFGLQQLMAFKGFSMENLCTFGDADNDYDMTKNAGIGVVMANGSEKTKSVADYITNDNNHDGISSFINSFLLC